jgi:hypothetical protein
MFSPRLKSAAYVAATFVLLTGAPLRGQTVEILEKSATFNLSSDLQIVAFNNKAVVVMVKGSPMSGSLKLTVGQGVNAKQAFDQVVSSYKTMRIPILSSSQQGNTFTIESRTGASVYDLRRIVLGNYLPQAPGALQKAFLGMVEIPNSSWGSAGGQSLRAALQSFRPKSSAFKDSEAPSLFVVDSSSLVTTSKSSYVIQGLALDNVSPVLLQVRTRAPGATGYSAWSDTRLKGTAKSKRWTYRLPMQKAKGTWLVQIRVSDAAGNRTAVASASVRRL